MKYVVVLLLIPLFIGCQSVTRTSHIDRTSAWAFDGRIQYISDERGIASVSWEYSENHHSAELSGPFGVGLTRIEGNASQIHIKDRDIDISGPSTQLMQQYLGWQAPLQALAYWLQGYPQFPTTHVLREDGELQFEELGWKIIARDFRLSETGQSRPHKLSISTSRLTLNFIISQWHNTPASNE